MSRTTRVQRILCRDVEQAGVERWLAQSGSDTDRAAYERLQKMETSSLR